MSGEGKSFLINDHFFQQAVSCPLKTKFLREENNLLSQRPVYRQRNKLNVRDAVASRFPNLKHTSDSLPEAAEETREWLQQSQVAICGAVVKTAGLASRIPILLKDENHITIIQIHGKLRKAGERVRINDAGSNRNTTSYLLKAAYRLQVVAQIYPDADISVQFYFPVKNFISSVAGLHRFRFCESARGTEMQEDLERLFARVDATKGAEIVRASIPGSVAHAWCENLPVKEAIDRIVLASERPQAVTAGQHEGCKWCDYRRSADQQAGCWQTHFGDSGLKYPDKHVFELMGQGNRVESDNGVFYQERAGITDGLRSFDLIKKYGGPAFTIQQRRNLQILKAKDEPVPRLWVKPGIDGIRKLHYPLHFIDFEAATYALPMKKGQHPYEPVYFQFSCHSLHKDGTLTHSQWIDFNEKNTDPHMHFAEQLCAIPGIESGTLIQFSPFERQAVNNLIRELDQLETTEHMAGKLKSIRLGSEKNYANRFFDLNECIKKNYYNNCLHEGMGLKQLLEAIIEWEKNNKGELLGRMAGKTEQLTHAYLKIQDNGSAIFDGSSAMNAWIAMKTGLLSPAEETSIPEVLKKYCSMDTYAMVVVIRHILNVTEPGMTEDRVIF